MPIAVAGTETILGIRGLRKRFGDLEAVRDLTLELRRGEVFGFLGPNGAGKTTTIRMICGLLRGDSGEVVMDGKSLLGDPALLRRLIGYCPQELVIWDTLTCLEQLTFLGTQYDIPRRDAQSRAYHLLEILGLKEKGRKKAGTLSGGMKRRLNLALALVHDPKVLILDEPQAGLDPQSRILVRELIRSLAGEKTVLLTTHEMDEADRLAHRIGIMDHGRLLVLDTPAALKAEHTSGEVLEVAVDEGQETALKAFAPTLPSSVSRLESLPGTLRLSGPNLHPIIPILLRDLSTAGIEASNLSLREPTLEDVFISLTGRGLRE
jgi:ABC-2 type transport system ATP-binding protein